MFGVPVAARPVTERPWCLGDQARLEQLEPVEEAEDLIPAPRPDRLEHGEALMRGRKEGYYRHEPRPGVSVIGYRLLELASGGRR
jgi:hypothetical protein